MATAFPLLLSACGQSAHRQAAPPTEIWWSTDVAVHGGRRSYWTMKVTVTPPTIAVLVPYANGIDFTGTLEGTTIRDAKGVAVGRFDRKVERVDVRVEEWTYSGPVVRTDRP